MRIGDLMMATYGRGFARSRRSVGGSATAGWGSCLPAKGIVMNHKKLLRLYREENLRVQTPSRPQASDGHAGADDAATGAPTNGGASTSSATRWSAAARIRVLAVVDDFTRENLALVAGHVDIRRSGSARAGCHHCCSQGQAADDRQRQRHRADQPGDPEVDAGPTDRLALHRTRQASAERVRGELQRSPCATSA